MKNPTTLPPSSPDVAPPAPGALPLQWKRQPLPPLQAVQVLDFRTGDIALLEVEDGRVWVTCDGLLEDYFLESGQRLSFTGPVRLRVSAEGHRPARLIWATHRAEDGAPNPPTVADAAPLRTAGSRTPATAPLPRGVINAV